MPTADEITRFAELLSQGNRCWSCGNCERCWAIWAPRPMTLEEHARGLFDRLKANAKPPTGETPCPPHPPTGLR